MISNSLPARDFDYFAEYKTKVKVFNNRGVSGIDGIVSTAAGIAAESDKPSFLIIGDLAFYYDISGLLALKKYDIPLVVILFNNGGGGIFETLPIAKEEDVDFEKYFKTPIDLDYKSIVKGFGGNYKLVATATAFSKEIKSAQKKKNFSVIEIIIDSKKSLSEREKYWTVLTAQVEAGYGNND
jgi:2-succinyl-5-enolpyruvyl-6-hydroxy-3-cyclohexene-1-carboxylate synthase